jgi:hypothetical protein
VTPITARGHDRSKHEASVFQGSPRALVEDIDRVAPADRLEGVHDASLARAPVLADANAEIPYVLLRSAANPGFRG